MSERRKQNLGPETDVERRKGPRRRDLSRALGDYVLELEQERAHRLELEEKNRTLEDEKYTDALTGLANRRSFDEKFPELVDIAHKNDEPLALLFIDSNDLHNLNKQKGHAAGDEFLKLIASTLRQLARPTDLVTRNGGDEFAVVLTGFKPMAGFSDIGLSTDTVNRFKNALGDRATIGIALLAPTETPDDLYARADSNCVANKPNTYRSVERLVS